MRVLTSQKFMEKLQKMGPDIDSSLLNFVAKVEIMDQNQYTTLLQNDQGEAENVYIRNLGNSRLFYTIERDNTGNIVVILLDVIKLLPQTFHSRNPNINSSINPYINSSINPNINSTLNPNINSSINPLINSSINPNINSSLNPSINSSINPNINTSINTHINSSLNPRINSSINPNINTSFSGHYVYNLQLQPVEFIIPADDRVLLFFDFSCTNTKFAIRDGARGCVVFDRNTNLWIAHMRSDGKEGYNLFTTANQWIGIIK